MRNGIFKRFDRLIVGNNRAFTIPEEENSTPSVDLRDNSSMAYFISSRTVVTGEIHLEIYRHIQQSSGLTKIGVRMALSNGLRHNYIARYGNKSKKTAVDDSNYHGLPSGEKYL